jgi:hypothetical protein
MTTVTSIDRPEFTKALSPDEIKVADISSPRLAPRTFEEGAQPEAHPPTDKEA